MSDSHSRISSSLFRKPKFHESANWSVIVAFHACVIDLDEMGILENPFYSLFVIDVFPYYAFLNSTFDNSIGQKIISNNAFLNV